MAVRVLKSPFDQLHTFPGQPRSGRCLAAQEIETLAGITAGDTVLCTSGILWVTQAGDPEDYLLKRGEYFISQGQGLVLVQAINDSACWDYFC